MISEDKQNKDNRATNNYYYPYSELMLEEIKGEYAVENERENKIGTKASAFITVIVAIITLYIPLIPFDKLKAFFRAGGVEVTQNEKTLAIIFLIILGTGLLSLVRAFFFLLKAYGIKGYNRVQVDDLLSIANFQGEEDDHKRSQIAQGIVAHYHQILRGSLDQAGNIRINSDSAESVSKGIKWTVVGFIILSVSTIALRIIVV